MAATAAAVPPVITIVPKAIPSLVSGDPGSSPPAATASAQYTPPPYVTPINYSGSNSRSASDVGSGTRHTVGFAPGDSGAAGGSAGASKVSQGWAPDDAGTSTTTLVSRSVSSAGQPVGTIPSYPSSPVSGAVAPASPQTYAYASPNYASRQPIVSGSAVAGQPIVPGSTVIQGQPVYSAAPAGFEQYFRFDISPEWVAANWDFVTACIGPVYTQGYRVSLVTGTAADDLTGVLTYYFNSDRKVHQIVFQGTTGDLERLKTTLNRRFQMGQRKVNDPSLIIYETPPSMFNQKNYMEARKPLILQHDQKYHRYEVYLVLNRPKEKTGLLW